MVANFSLSLLNFSHLVFPNQGVNVGQVAQRTATHCESLTRQLQEAKEEIFNIAREVRSFPTASCIIIPSFH
jgi:predicted transcriptional regulator